MGQNLRELQPAYHTFVAQFLAVLARYGVRARITSVHRDESEQALLWKNYQRCGCSQCPPRPGHCFPAAPPGQSTHAKRIAFDAVFEPAGAQEAVGRLWERLGFTWGGRFGDKIHFDFRPNPRH